MEKLDQIFRQLDDWRHLPTYQLERRADIFFSVYLREILQACTGQVVHEVIIPEFPLHQNAIDSNSETRRHCCADYLAFSSDLKQAFLIELKTDPNSSRDAQVEYLQKAKDVGLKLLLTNMLDNFYPQMKQQSRQKRFYLLKKLESVGLYSDLEAAATFIAKDRQQGFTNALAQAKVASTEPEISLVCIHPKNEPSKKQDDGMSSGEATFDFWIPFAQVIEVVNKHSDALSQRFSESLHDWSENAAGSRVTP